MIKNIGTILQSVVNICSAAPNLLDNKLNNEINKIEIIAIAGVQVLGKWKNAPIKIARYAPRDAIKAGP